MRFTTAPAVPGGDLQPCRGPIRAQRGLRAAARGAGSAALQRWQAAKCQGAARSQAVPGPERLPTEAKNDGFVWFKMVEES